MSEKEKEYKIKVPLFKDGELEQFNKMLDNDLDNIVSKVTKQILRDKELIFMQKVIDKQQKEIEELKELNKKLDAQIDLEWVENNYIEKSKYNQLLKVIDKLLEEEAVNVMYYDTEEDRQEYIKQLKEKLYKEVENE